MSRDIALAEVFAPLSECPLFNAAFGAQATPPRHARHRRGESGPAYTRRTSRAPARDMLATVGASRVSFVLRYAFGLVGGRLRRSSGAV